MKLGRPQKKKLRFKNLKNSNLTRGYRMSALRWSLK